MSKQVVAAGFIVYRRVQSSVEYLLLKSSIGKDNWTPPKGRVDPGETEMETAWRETEEEAGLTTKHLKLVDNFQKTLNYEVHSKPKRVEYWLAELSNPETKVTLSHEHVHHEWLSLQDAMEYSNYPNMQKTLLEAHNFIMKSL